MRIALNTKTKVLNSVLFIIKYIFFLKLQVCKMYFSYTVNSRLFTELTGMDTVDDEQPATAAKKAKRSGPPEINGYTKPSYSFPQLITQALAICNKRRASAMEICDIIAQKQPYYQYCQSNWKGSVYAALAKRKKFFVIVDTNVDGTYVWSFNPTFEEYMLNKWVPKYLRKKTVMENEIEKAVSLIMSDSGLPLNPVIMSTESLNPVIVSSASLRPVDPVIVSSASLRPVDSVVVSSASLRPVDPVIVSSASLRPVDPVIVSTASLRPVDPVIVSTASFRPVDPVIVSSASLRPDNPVTVCSASFRPVDPVIVSSASFKPNDPVIVSSASLRPVDPVTVCSKNFRSISPVIVNSKRLRSSSPEMVRGTTLETEDLTVEVSSTGSGPEFALADPDQVWSLDNTEVAAKPWEPEVTVSENITVSETQRAVKSITDTQNQVGSNPTFKEDVEVNNMTCKNTFQQKKRIYRPSYDFVDSNPTVKDVEVDDLTCEGTSQDKELHFRRAFDAAASKKSNKVDFSMDNFKGEHGLLKEEIRYRESFDAEHHGVQKFRLHCTVCDVHLGTSGVMARTNVRLHAWLAVLTCARCYRVTSSPSLPVASVCHWCARFEGVHFCCSTCSTKFCEACVKRNFGTKWFYHISLKNVWLCFLCDSKQIWPHRAIAHFLLAHYNKLKMEKNFEENLKSTWKPEEFQFFAQDLSTCCKRTAPKSVRELLNSSSTKVSTEVPLKPFIETVTALPLPVLPHTEDGTPSDNEGHQAPPVSASEPQSLVIKNNPPNHIYVQTSTGVNSLTLNTGTQYIHNVYPDKSYVVMHPPNTNNTPQPTNFPTVSNTKTQSESPVITFQHPSLDVASDGVTFGKHVKRPTAKQLINSNNIPTLSAGPPNVEVIPGGGFITSVTYSTVSPNHRPSDVSTPKLTEREMIERRPMPKSKKQSLLRTVLMNESIESMKKNLQVQRVHSTYEGSQTPTLCEQNKQDNTSVAQTNFGGAEQNVEEPILKSIIHTATERLLDLKKRQNLTKSVKTSSICTETSVIDLDAEESFDSSDSRESTLEKAAENTSATTHLPKIKIRPLQELKEPEDKLNKTNKPEEIKDCNISFVTKPVHVLENPPIEVNVTDLKRGIIEASRTLVSTQKKLKELAKVISSNLCYKTDEAVELITKFQNILMSCRNQVDVIDTNVCNQFVCLHPNILEKIKRPPEVAVCNSSIIISKERQRIKKAETLENRKVPFAGNSVEMSSSEVSLSASNGTDPRISSQWQVDGQEIEESVWADGSPFKRKRDLVDFNPMGKKLILGSPEITPEDLEHIPNIWDSSNTVSVPGSQSIRDHYVLKKKSKKKNIWLTKSRKYKKRFNKDGTVRRKVGRPSNSTKWAEIDENDHENLSSSKPIVRHNIERLRKRIKKLPVPLRLSERNHPSSVEYVARFLSSSSEESGPVRPIKYEIKPCSVVIHRLSRRVELLLQKRF